MTGRNLRRSTQDTVDRIVNVFSGADGGAEFAEWLSLVADMDARAAGGDADAEQVIQQVHRFRRMLDVVGHLRGRKT